jgi:hypothetical protein
MFSLKSYLTDNNRVSHAVFKAKDAPEYAIAQLNENSIQSAQVHYSFISQQVRNSSRCVF